MKKYFVGFIVGVFLTLPFSVFADDISNVGKKIAAEFTVKLDGQELPVKAVAFEGTSYAPVRAVGEALGLEVDFQNGEVILNKKSGGDRVDIQKRLDMTNDFIDQHEEMIERQRSVIESLENNDSDKSLIKPYYDRLESLENDLAELLKRKSDLEAQLEAAE